jgi:DNA-binding CsgD family transcriptional regulator
MHSLPWKSRLVGLLALNDTQSLHQGIQTLYTLSNLETFGVDALTIVNQLVPSDMPTLHATKVRTRQVSHSFLPNFPGFTPEMEKVIDRHFGEHPIIHHMPQTLSGAYQISDFVSQKEFHCFEGLYQQFLRPLDIEEQMTFFLPNATSDSWSKVMQTDATLVGFSLHRAQHNFTERDRLILNLLRPHLFQAYCNVQHYQQLQNDLDQLQQSLNHLGVVILDALGRVQSIAPQAIKWLETYFSAPTCTAHLPDHLWSWVKHQITELTKTSDLPKSCLPLHIQQAGKELVIRLVIEQPGERYLLLLEEQTPSPMNSLALLGLSQRETEVLTCVMQGKDNKAIATHLSINVSTVRKHLESIYSKWAVHSRTEAIAQALAKLGILQSPPML